MDAYKVRLVLQAPIATPLHSGTLFGHLCWAYRLQQGEAALTEWLADFEQQPLLLSDALPRDCLPRPLLATAPRLPPRQHQSFPSLDRLQKDKRLRKSPWMSMTDFLTLRDDLNETRLLNQLRDHENRDHENRDHENKNQHAQVIGIYQAHNTINRHTNTTPESGGLYFMDEHWYSGVAAELDVYVQSVFSQEKLTELFSLVGETGFGRDATLGRGRFIVQVETADSALFKHDGTRYLSLSHGILSANMIAPRYKLHTHYGKLGGLYAGGVRSPFKHPLLLTKPGATFTPHEGDLFGALLRGVHPHHPEICQHALHLCLPYTETAGDAL